MTAKEFGVSVGHDHLQLHDAILQEEQQQDLLVLQIALACSNGWSAHAKVLLGPCRDFCKDGMDALQFADDVLARLCQRKAEGNCSDEANCMLPRDLKLMGQCSPLQDWRDSLTCPWAV